MRMLVCGGRDYRDYKRMFDVLTEFAPTAIIHGDARGADTGADVWAVVNGIEPERYPAKWRVNGVYNPGAGFDRNREMIEKGHPDVVVAFPGGSGTGDMKWRAGEAGIRVIAIPGKGPWPKI